ncbi:MAG: hypothetical protein L0Y44_12740 [Phycisphaerales bacterium]|nr:hypothetical protein [Phycisphaerales bacterium]MCI0631510.1 hypothetical protein [Phycisphaerales bacterium]
MQIDLDQAISHAFIDFARPAEVIILDPSFARAFSNVVVRFHGAPVAADIVLSRLLDLDRDGRLPVLVVMPT